MADCSSPIRLVPGPAGKNADPGIPGAAGIDAFTLLAANFTMPAIGLTAVATVAQSAWAVIGQSVFLQGAGTLIVTAVADATHVTLQNPAGYAGNVAGGTVIAGGSKLGPSGLIGPAGAAGAATTLNALSPTTTKGDIIADNGTNNPAASDVRLAAGTNGQILTSDTTAATGLRWQGVVPNAATDNVVPRFDASGATTPTPLQSSGILVTDTGEIQTTPTGGNARGVKAVDLQTTRAAATQVASGFKSIIVGGINNTASGIEAIAVGSRNTCNNDGAVAIGGDHAVSGNAALAAGSQNIVSGDASVALGSINSASGLSATVGGGTGHLCEGDYATVAGGTTCSNHNDYATIGGGQLNVASDDYLTVGGGRQNSSIGSGLGIYGILPGGYAGKVDLYGQLAHAAGAFTTPGDAQTSELIWRISTTNATVTELLLDGLGGTHRSVLWGFSSWAFSILTVARNTTTDLSAVWKTEGGIKRSGGAPLLIGAVVHTLIANDGEPWMVVGGVLVDADGANIALRIRVTGAAATNIKWVAHARLVQVNY